MLPQVWTTARAPLPQRLGQSDSGCISDVFKLWFNAHSQMGITAVMSTNARIRPWLRLCTGVLAAGGAAVSLLGLASGTAQAAPPPAPLFHYHWCPGDIWNPAWGNNWDVNTCHDWDDNGVPAGWGPPPPGAPPPPPPPPWAPWATPVWNPGTNGWGFFNGGVWVPL